MNRKKQGILIIWISVFVLFTSLVFFIIGYNSNTLVNSVFKTISLIILILSIIALGLGIFLLIKNKKRTCFKKVKTIIFSVIVGIYAVGCTGFLILLYGPSTGFKNWLITTAMATMNHKYYCEWFYSDEVIQKVLGDNFIDDSGLETNPNLVDHKETTTFYNEYEKEILERDKDDLYKIIRFKVNDQDAYLAAVYDPSKISVGLSKYLGEWGQNVGKMAKEQNAVLAINGGGFMDPGHTSSGGTPVGITISNGKVISNNKYNRSQGIIAFDNNNTLVLTRNKSAQELVDSGIRDAVTMGPFLIVNGTPSKFKGNGGWGVAARTAIGQRKDGIVLFLVVDSNEFRTKGASMVDLLEIMKRYGAVNAANLDGGTSSVMAVNGEIINDPIDSALRHKTRPIPTMFKVVE